MFISLPLCSGALKCKGKTLLITLLLKDQQPGEMYFVTFSLWSLFFRNENGDIHSGSHARAWRWVFNESLLPFPWALTEGHSRSCLWSILIATGDADPASWYHIWYPPVWVESILCCLSHTVEVREDARCKQRLKGKILMSDFLLVGEQSFRGNDFIF